MFEFAVAGLSDPVQATVPWLSLSILVPIVGALLVPLVPDQGDGKQVRWYALIVTLITFLITVAAYLTGYDPNLSGLQLSERVSWLPDLGLTWAVGADGLSMPLILLTSFITSLACLAAWPVSFKPRLFYFLLLAMDGGQIAVFAVQDMLLFFLAWELELIPVYLLLAIWGGKKRQYAATKFILYTAGSSLFILLAALAMGFFGGGTPSFEYTALAAKDFGTGFQLLCYAGLLIAFGVKLPIVPLHTWLPDAHGEATAPVHMLLAGILLKMGGYALLRFNCELLPAAHSQFAPLLIVLGVVNIIYAALTSFAQHDQQWGELRVGRWQQFTVEAQQGIAAHLQQDAGQQHVHRCCGFAMGIRQPGVQGHDRQLHAEGDQQPGVAEQLKARAEVFGCKGGVLKTCLLYTSPSPRD